MDVAARIDELWESGELEAGPIEEAVGLLDRGEARVAEKRDGEWVVNEWAKKAILLYFRLRKVAPMDVGYVETHGTGTALGDPIEVDALRAVFGGPRETASPCVLGAAKSNIGHLEPAAGVAGLIKVVMALRNERIPPNLHFRTLNPRIKLKGTPLVIPQQTLPFRAGTRPRIAGR